MLDDERSQPHADVLQTKNVRFETSLDDWDASAQKKTLFAKKNKKKNVKPVETLVEISDSEAPEKLTASMTSKDAES